MSATRRRRSRSRPLGITALCVLGFISAPFSLLGMLAVAGQGPTFAVLGLFGLALVVAKVVVLYGLWTLQEWGYRWSLVFYGLSAVLNLVSFSLLALFVDGVIIAYLLSKAHHFR